MEKIYKLSDDVITGDKLSENIYIGRKILYSDIKNFSAQSANNNDSGSYAENIITTIFGGGNLNHLSKNYAHFDVAIVDEIEGIVKEDEIISVKCSYNFKNVRNILQNTKAIKLNSVFPYLLSAISDFSFISDRSNFSSNNLINIGTSICKNYKKVNFEKVINVTLYYLIFKNNVKEIDNYTSDINNMLGGEINLKYGTYIDYETKVKKEIDLLDSPISIATVHIDNTNLDSDEITCVINKTNTIELRNYWYGLIKIWSDEEYYLKPSDNQYLKYGEIKNLFNLEKDGFPIQISVSIGSYSIEKVNVSDEERIKGIKDINRGRVSKLKTASKLNDADFGKYNNEIVKTFNQIIDDLIKNPSKILKYQEFIKK